MKEGRDRHLDLTPLLEEPKQGNHRSQDLVLLGDHLPAVLAGEALSLLDESPDARHFPGAEAHLPLPERPGEPAEIEPHLQITDITGGESCPGAAQREQLPISRVWHDLSVPIRVEKGT